MNDAARRGARALTPLRGRVTFRALRVAPRPRVPRVAPGREGRHVSKLTVLIADDLKFFLEVEKSYLVRGGFDVLTAASGAEAVKVALAKNPHLVLLDLEMPEMDGAAACAAMRKEAPLQATPIIIMSARGDAKTRDRCLKAGCTEFVIKPEKPDELLGLVARILTVRKREAARVTVVFSVKGEAGGHQIIGQAHDLSATGLLLETKSPLKPGTLLDLEFFLPGSHAQIRTKAEVVRAIQAGDSAWQAGLKFSDLSSSDEESILDYVSS